MHNFIIVVQWRHISSESAVELLFCYGYGIFYCLWHWNDNKCRQLCNKCSKCVNIWNGSSSDSFQQSPGPISISRAPRGSMTITNKMHSSGMHTIHLLTISQHALHRWGLPGGVCLGGVCPGLGVCPGVSSWGYLPLVWWVYPSMQWDRRPPPHGQTDTCENTTFANFFCGR